MADLTNRSRYRVAVRNRDDLTRFFPHNKTTDIQVYLGELRAAGLKPRADQLDESWLVRIRTVGQRPVFTTFPSRQAAVEFLQGAAEAERRGALRGYAASRQVTVADLFIRYLLEEAPKHKSRLILTYSLENWLLDSGPQGVAAFERYRDAALKAGRPVKPRKAQKRKVSNELAWIHKTLTDVTTVDIEKYMSLRRTVVAPATVDREIDRLKAVFQVATKIWDYQLARNPMDAVRRPKYFNERERRISPDEERLLLAELARMDRERSIELALKCAVDAEVADRDFSSVSTRKRGRAAARVAIGAALKASTTVAPYLQAFYLFQVHTAARRGETLGLTWDRVDLRAGTAFLPETKNGRPRKLVLRASLVRLLAELPRSGERVIPLGLDYIVGSWTKACSAAGIEDLHIHDLRHEALSRLAETGEFSLPELQLFSGHRDLRMLMRYSHLCASRLAKKIDANVGHESATPGGATPGALNLLAATSDNRSNVLEFPRHRRLPTQ